MLACWTTCSSLPALQAACAFFQDSRLLYQWRLRLLEQNEANNGSLCEGRRCLSTLESTGSGDQYPRLFCQSICGIFRMSLDRQGLQWQIRHFRSACRFPTFSFEYRPKSDLLSTPGCQDRLCAAHIALARYSKCPLERRQTSLLSLFETLTFPLAKSLGRIECLFCFCSRFRSCYEVFVHSHYYYIFVNFETYLPFLKSFVVCCAF